MTAKGYTPKSAPKKSALRGSRFARAMIFAMPILVAGLGVLLWINQRSLERGNRLFRSGKLEEATEVYRQRAARPDAAAPDVYNFGTALLALGSAEAEAELIRAAEGSDSAAAQVASYNLGYIYLSRVDPVERPDSAVAELIKSVAMTRRALQLNPNDDNARWNLALAERTLNELGQRRNDSGFLGRLGDDETFITLDRLARSNSGTGASGREPENPNAGSSSGQRESPRFGAQEARTNQDPGPMSQAQAVQSIQSLVDDPEELIRGIIWSQRPNVEFWREAFPGGNW